MTITLINLRQTKPSQPYDVKVDRTSILGNPFTGDRMDVCDKYIKYFNTEVKHNEAFIRELRRLYKLHKIHGQLRLFCWCVPLRCHSTTIREFLEREY